MAKISARGATELARWKSDDGQRTLVLASDGRLLLKVTPDSGYTVRAKKVTLEKAEAYAQRSGYRR